jgi:hypothetical protein
MPEHLDLANASDEDLSARLRTLMQRMGPIEEELGRLRAQVQQVVSEQKKRERALHLRGRMQVRTTVKEGQLPNLQQIAESSNDLVPVAAALRDLRFFRDSGTEIGIGYATAREPSLFMTNGREQVAIKTIAELRSRYLDGYDFGTTAHRGVRIHIPNSRTEKVIPAAEVYVKPG